MGTEHIRRALARPVDGASAAAFRILFGAVMLLSSGRFVARGWVQELYVAPSFHFGWPGFQWLEPWPAWGLYLHMAVLAVAAAGVMLGLFYRVSALIFLLAFICLELFDRTYYLNHYYLVSLIALLCCAMPLHRVASLDRLRGAVAGDTVPAWVPKLLRAQLAIVYFYAGLAKLDTDWLLRAEPLQTWLQVHADVPWVGPYLAVPAVAFAMAWAGALFDLSIGPLLLWRRTRSWAYLAVIVFHGFTGILFPIGVFPWVMVALTTIFFPPGWPRALSHATARASRPEGQESAGGLPRRPSCAPLAPAPAALLIAYLALQLLLPLRHMLYPGEVNWTEEGFRFAWRVMLIEKTGHVELRVHALDDSRSWTVLPAAELTAVQVRMMATQPDMIAQYARHVGQRFEAELGTPVRVHADAWAALNGRPPQRLIDPHADLSLDQGAFAHCDYILPLQ